MTSLIASRVLMQLAPHFQTLKNVNPSTDFESSFSNLFHELQIRDSSQILSVPEVVSIFQRLEPALHSDEEAALAFLKVMLRLGFSGYSHIGLDIYKAQSIQDGMVFGHRVMGNSKSKHSILLRAKADSAYDKYVTYSYNIEASSFSLSYSYRLSVKCPEKENP